MDPASAGPLCGSSLLVHPDSDGPFCECEFPKGTYRTPPKWCECATLKVFPNRLPLKTYLLSFHIVN